MTYQTIALTDIVLSESRQRKDYGDIEDLASSIQAMGLLQPLGIEEGTMQLVWGGRRLKALHALKEERVECKIVPKGCTPFELEALELEENIRRKDLSPAEECRAYKRIDDLKKALLGDAEKDRIRSGWSKRKTAALLGESPSGVAEKIRLAEAMDIMPELEECKTIDEMRKGFKSAIDDAMVQEIVSTGLESNDAKFKFAEHHYNVGDFFEAVKPIGAGIIHCSIVDTPYAIDLETNKKVDIATQNLDRYTEWSRDEFLSKSRQVAEEVYRLSSSNAWVIWWFGIQWYSQLWEILIETGFKVDPIPAVWFKTNSSGQSKQPSMYLGRVYETFFICSKGDPAIAQRGKPNVFMYKTVSSAKKVHTTEKPLGLMIDILKIFTFPGGKVLVPFLGSGVDLRACYSLNLTGFGWDLSEEQKKKFLYQVNKDIEENRYEQDNKKSS